MKTARDLRECARIQLFPDNFEFMGSASQKIQQNWLMLFRPLLAQRFS
ncbi:hypothetical protein BGS_0599 [Beggiatoa sp. SS]|nr:hypothetical protein BGS_0599 [Beggiatoa sp. SS]